MLTMEESIFKELLECYRVIVDAYRAGANVTKLVNEFNSILASLGRLSLDEVKSRIVEVESEALKLAEIARLNTLWSIVATVTVSLIVVVIILLLYTRYRYRLWLLWIKLRSGYRVYPSQSSGSSKSMIISGEVWAVILALIVVASVFTLAQAITAGRVTEPFSAIGLLGPKMKIGDYPTNVMLGDEIKLYVYIGNHMGYPVWYIVYAKLGNKTTFINSTVPAKLTPIWSYQVLLNHNTNTTIPVTLVMNRTGVNLKLIFELWYIDPETGQQKYYAWNHLYLNVTAPPIKTT